MQKFDFDISIAIPVYNDEEVINILYERLSPVLTSICNKYEIVFVDDGSKDNSFQLLKKLRGVDDNIKVIKLARNFGQSNAISAALDHCFHDVVVLMDSDLQDRPEDIPKLLTAMVENNVPMAITRWKTRQDSYFKKLSSRFFHQISNRVTQIEYPQGLGGFRVFRREIIDDLNNLPEKCGTTLSLMYWMDYEYAIVDLDRDPRQAGSSGYTLRKMVKLSFDRIFSFSILPIQAASVLGFFLCLGSVILAGYYLFQKFFLNSVVPGWTSLIVLILILSGLNFLFLGIIGEYLGRIFMEAKQRPKYIVRQFIDKNDLP